jgi:hypothetical protein
MLTYDSLSCLGNEVEEAELAHRVAWFQVPLSIPPRAHGAARLPLLTQGSTISAHEYQN